MANKRILTSVWMGIFVSTLGVMDIEAAPLPSCSTYLNCGTCSNSTLTGANCKWCPLSIQCYQSLDSLNPCTLKQNINTPGECYETVQEYFVPSSAYLNTLYSAAAYASNPRQCLARLLNKPNDFRIVHYIGRDCTDLDITGNNKCFAYTGFSKQTETITVAFKGSGGLEQTLNIIASTIAASNVNFVIGGRVNPFFASAYNKLNPCIEEVVKQLVEKYPTYKVVVTGHSLGGAIATLTAAALVHNNITTTDNTALYVFGTPRVGDKNFAYAFGKLVKESWRVVHDNDPVSQFPPCNPILGCIRQGGAGPYHHGNEIYYPASEMDVDSEYIICRGNEDRNCSLGQFNLVLCGLNFKDCVEDHAYFGLQVGQICDEDQLRFVRDALPQHRSNVLDECTIDYKNADDKE